MEIFGILFSIPVAFLASTVYSFALARVVAPFAFVSRCLVWASAVVLAAFLIEILLLASIGAVRARGVIGPIFYPAHSAVFFLGTPALANVLILRKTSALRRHWYAAIPLCTAFALVLVLLQYGVTEALYGVEGDDGPYSHEHPHGEANR